MSPGTTRSPRISTISAPPPERSRPVAVTFPSPNAISVVSSRPLAGSMTRPPRRTRSVIPASPKPRWHDKAARGAFEQAGEGDAALVALSPYSGPTICTPTGNPFAARPAGATVAIAAGKRRGGEQLAAADFARAECRGECGRRPKGQLGHDCLPPSFNAERGISTAATAR